MSTILEESVRKSGRRLRITAQLIDVEDGYHIRSCQFDGEMKDIFDIQDEISLAIVDQLKFRLLKGEKDKALDNIEKAYQEREAYMVFIEPWLIFDCLRSEARFQALLKKMNLDQ